MRVHCIQWRTLRERDNLSFRNVAIVIEKTSEKRGHYGWSQSVLCLEVPPVVSIIHTIYSDILGVVFVNSNTYSAKKIALGVPTKTTTTTNTLTFLRDRIF